MRLGTQLLVLSLGLLALPWLGYRYLDEMQDFLLQGQKEAQLLAAQAIATGLEGRPELLADAVVPRRDESSLYVYPTDRHLLVDGYAEDWEARVEPVAADGPNAPFTLRAAQRGAFVYLLLEVKDSTRVYRHPGIPRLDRSDQLRLTLAGADEPLHLLLTVEGVGPFKPLAVDPRWQGALPGTSSDQRILAAWQERSGGYRVELRLPLDIWSGPPALGVTLVDVRDGDERSIAALHPLRETGPVPLFIHSPELQRLMAGLRQGDRHLWIFDRHAQVRAVSNIDDALPGHLTRHRAVIQRALEGRASAFSFEGADANFILAAHPVIRANGEVLGVVAVEVSTTRIRDLNRLTLLRSAGSTALVFGLLLAGLLLFAYRLTRRIAVLRRETRSSIDAQGRVVKPELRSEQGAGDQLGDLARDISAMLGRLHQYTRFLERMPRTLRHELSNPLNTIGTSLELYRSSRAPDPQDPYLLSAERGVTKLSLIINSLTEAASLEESLRDEVRLPLDLEKLLAQYCDHLQRVHGDRAIRYQGAGRPVWVAGADLRLEQLLDKLMDNAVDFSEPGSPIQVALEDGDDFAEIRVTNRGAAVPAEVAGSLFDSLVSSRSDTRGQTLHLGIGLYIVKLIAQFHGGSVRCDCRDGSTTFAVRLPAS